MKKIVLGLLLLSLATSSFCIHKAFAVEINQALYSELLTFDTDGQIEMLYGVPCVKVHLKPGQSINYFCRFVKYFDENFHFYRSRIALINRIEFMAEVGAKHSLSTDHDYIWVPVNFETKPDPLPDFIENISHLPKFILIDIGQQYIGLYEYGRQVELFPISSGKKGTPERSFAVIKKEKNHYSRLYGNAWMPLSIQIFGNYFIHGGILPGYAASHGCIRLIYEDAKIIYMWAEIGTPGRIIKTTT